MKKLIVATLIVAGFFFLPVLTIRHGVFFSVFDLVRGYLRHKADISFREKVIVRDERARPFLLSGLQVGIVFSFKIIFPSETRYFAPVSIWSSDVLEGDHPENFHGFDQEIKPNLQNNWALPKVEYLVETVMLPNFLILNNRKDKVCIYSSVPHNESYRREFLNLVKLRPPPEEYRYTTIFDLPSGGIANVEGSVLEPGLDPLKFYDNAIRLKAEICVSASRSF